MAWPQTPASPPMWGPLYTRTSVDRGWVEAP
jgi:hypothetical protein